MDDFGTKPRLRSLLDHFSTVDDPREAWRDRAHPYAGSAPFHRLRQYRLVRRLRRHRRLGVKTICRSCAVFCPIIMDCARALKRPGWAGVAPSMPESPPTPAPTGQSQVIGPDRRVIPIPVRRARCSASTQMAPMPSGRTGKQRGWRTPTTSAGAKIILEDHVHRYGPARIGRQINVFEFEIAFEFLEKSGFGIKTGVAIVASTVRHCFSSASPRSRRDDSPVQHSGQRSRSKTADQIASASITVVILP